MMKFVISYLFTVSVVLTTASCRKLYDVEEEAIKLYGEDLKSVLLRFRKSADYLHILQDKAESINEHLNLVTTQLVEFYKENILNCKVIESLGFECNNSKDSLRSKLHFQPAHLRQEKKARTQEEEEESSSSATNLLDQYMFLHKGLPWTVINSFKDMGFEYAGKTIHAIIDHMGSEDSPTSSTRLPFADQDLDHSQTTTAHPLEHQVQTTLINSAVYLTNMPFRHVLPWRIVARLVKSSTLWDGTTLVPENPENPIDETFRHRIRVFKY